LRILLRGEFSGVCSISLKAVNIRLTNYALFIPSWVISFHFSTSREEYFFFKWQNLSSHYQAAFMVHKSSSCVSEKLPLDHTESINALLLYCSKIEFKITITSMNKIQ
jgi:hypothetical protein